MTDGSRRAGRDLAIVALFTAALLAPFLGKAFHVDEPLFLAPAAHILSDPLHPLAFTFNWYGRGIPMASINNTPPLMLYLLAAGLKVSGGSELGLRLFFLPVPILAALALYLLAARFIRRPLLPVLICVAGPGFLINMGLLYPETLAAALGFWGLYALARGVDDGSPPWFWASAGLIATALLAKYFAAFLLLPAAGFCLQRGVPRRKALSYLAVCVGGVALLGAWDCLKGGAASASAWSVMSEAARLPFWSPVHKLRSLLCFVGGVGVAPAVWPLLVWRPSRRASVVLGVCAAILFLPALDLAPVVRDVDRATGLILGGGTLAGFWMLFAGCARGRGWALWAPWALGAALLVVLYWSVVARLAVFCVPPLVLAAAEALEAQEPRRLSWIYGSTLALTIGVSLPLARVDYDYAQGQKAAVRELDARYLSRGRSVWSAAHWGLQYYLERAGGRELDWNRGGWDAVRPGDVVVLTKINTQPMVPHRPVRADVHQWTLGEPIPLRLMSGWTGEGGFYTNVYGFLPYSYSREPLERITIVEVSHP